MRVITAEAMRDMDAKCISSGIPGKTLMERAGTGVAKIALRILDDFENKRVSIVAGPGNNGGDGWVASRILFEKNVSVEVFSVSPVDKLKGDAKGAFESARKTGVLYNESLDGKIELDRFDLIIDALLGTGAKGEPASSIGEAVQRISLSSIPVLAIDMPTGVDANTGKAAKNAIRAYATAILGLPKLGQFIYPGREYVGRLFVVDIGIPEKYIDELGEGYEIDSTEDMLRLLPFRPGDGHKGDFGKALIIAGSEGMSGAVVLAAESCLRSGTGLVEMAVPKSLVDTVESLFREAISRPLQEVKSKRCLSVRALGDILRLTRDCDAIALGPGIGTNRETVDLVGRLIPKIEVPMVIDADGLNCISILRKRGIRIEFGGKTIMTPHPGELARLIGKSIDEITERRYEDMRLWARELGADVLVLKGSPTTISAQTGNIYINLTGNDGMATGGSGDVLTGLITGFLAQGLDPLDASRLGVYLHGLAGDLAKSEIGARGMIAGDICDFIPEAILSLENYRYFESEEE